MLKSIRLKAYLIAVYFNYYRFIAVSITQKYPKSMVDTHQCQGKGGKKRSSSLCPLGLQLNWDKLVLYAGS